MDQSQNKILYTSRFVRVILVHAGVTSVAIGFRISFLTPLPRKKAIAEKGNHYESGSRKATMIGGGVYPA